MQHSESRPSFAVLPRDSSLARGENARLDLHARSDDNALWFVFTTGIVGLALALTYTLAQAIALSWVFVD